MDSFNKPVTHWVTIRVYRGNESTEIINFLRWTDMSFAVRTKWSWYFKYRAALEQVKHPRSVVKLDWGNKDATGKSLIEQMEQRLISAKAKVTKVANAIGAHEREMGRLLIWEPAHDQDYQKALAKLTRVHKEKTELEEQINKLKKEHDAPGTERLREK